MSFMMTCDSCGAEIPAQSRRGSVQTMGDGTVAGPQLDLCANCMGPVEQVTTVQTGKKKENDRRNRLIAEQQAIMQEQMAASTAAANQRAIDEAKAKVK